MFEFITEMTVADMFAVCLFWLASLLVGTILVWKFVIPRFLTDIITNMIAHPKPKTEEAIRNLAVLIITSPVNTGKKIKDEDGKEHDEIIPLLVYAGREIWATFNHKLSAAKGGAKTQANQIIEGALAQTGGDPRQFLPIALQAASRGEYMPLLVLVTQQLLNKPQGASNAQGGGTNW